MRAIRDTIGIALLAASLLGCGGSLNTSGKDGSAPTGACATLGACECMATSDRCAARTEACWCPSECNPNIACICGGGRFLGCEDKAVVAACASELAAVQDKCAGQIPDISYLCNDAVDPNCVSSCLANLKNTGLCSEVDCRFCQLCDCAPPPTTSPFATCIASCSGSQPARL